MIPAGHVVGPGCVQIELAVDRPVLAADVGTIRRLFGWTARFTIDDALLDLWRDPDLSETLMAKYR